MFNPYRKMSVIVGIILCLFSSAFGYSGGTGEPNDPYQIGTVSDWQQLMSTSSHWNKHFIMTADVNLLGIPVTPIGNFDIIFTGTFNGNYHVIRNVNINMPTSSYVGLFGHISYSSFGSQISNLGIIDVNIRGDSLIGGLCGGNSGNITKCYSTGTATGSKDTGGLCGMANGGTISNCYSTGNVNGGGGGLCGGNSGNITNCYSAGNVNGGGGGLCGGNSGNITNCYSTGNVSGWGGGLCGENLGSIISCYSTGNISGGGGGLCGYNWGGRLTNCYSTGNVSGTSTSIGGLCGYNDHGSITNCYSTGSISGSSYVGGLCGKDYGGSIISCYFLNTAGPDNDLGEPLTDVQMKQQASFTGWDFSGENADGISSYWIMRPGSYPQLYVFDSNFIPYEFDGQGTAADPYLIYDANGLGAVWQKPYNCYKLVNNINLAGIQWSDAIIPSFKGSFDGDNHIISKLSISGNSYIGLFGMLNAGSIVKNVGIEDVNITGTWYYIGGLCGCNNNSSIYNCYSTGNVRGYSYTGGLCGKNSDGSITNCYSTGNVSGDYNFTGGLYGYNYYGKITNCYSIGIVAGSSYTGGLCGYNLGYGRNSNCYFAGNVSGTTNVGGLCGGNLDGSFTSCYFLVTAGPDNGYGEPLTDEQMKQQSSFIGWDFVGETANGTKDIWTICEGITYPTFVYQNAQPIANAGPDQTVYAWIDGIAEVELDGSASSDIDECNGLTYYWSWVINGNTYKAEGANPTIELPVGVHMVQLVVNDGLADSVPDDVNITVIAPLKSKLEITPCVINRSSYNRHKPERILAFVRMPEGIARKDISNEPLTLYPGDIEASRQWVVPIPYGFGRHRKLLVGIFAFFDKNDVLDAIPTNGRVELKVAGELTCGRYFYGSDTVTIIGPKRPCHFPKK